MRKPESLKGSAGDHDVVSCQAEGSQQKGAQNLASCEDPGRKHRGKEYSASRRIEPDGLRSSDSTIVLHKLSMTSLCSKDKDKQPYYGQQGAAWFGLMMLKFILSPILLENPLSFCDSFVLGEMTNSKGPPHPHKL